MIRCVPPEAVNKNIPVEECNLNLLLFGNDLAEQDSLVRRLLARVMLLSLFSHRISSLGKPGCRVRGTTRQIKFTRKYLYRL